MSNIDYSKILRKARIVLVKTPWKKILAFSFCLFLSAIFWFIQIYRQNFNATYSLPVKYIAIPENVVFETKLPDRINITIKDNGYALFKNFFTHRHDSIVVNVADIIKYSSSKTLQGAAFEQVIKEKLLPSSELVNYDPTRVSFYYTPLDEKKIPVIFDGQIFLQAGYLLNGDIQVSPDSVIVYGAKDVLNSMDYAYTVSDTINNLKSNDPINYRIKSVYNAKFVPDHVQIVVPIDKYTQKDVSVSISCINLPSDIKIKFFPSSAKISFLVGISKYESITDQNFSIQFDYEELKDIKETSIPLRITSSPDHIQNLVMTPSEVEFIFEKN